VVNKKDITGIVLAGGKSSRMGSDKGLLILKDSLFIEHIMNQLYQITDNIIIVSSNSNYDEFGVKRVTDIIKNSGPLGGLYTGLYHSKTEYNLVLSCDVPLINQSILNILIEGIDSESDIVQLQSRNNSMPLIAIYKRQCLNTCYELLNKGEKRLRVAVNEMMVKTININPELDKYVRNINTVEQLINVRNEVEH
jgi:molybdopterin-guanine dinucleotide biosynthesis protein A